jgi:hypothetical protein
LELKINGGVWDNANPASFPPLLSLFSKNLGNHGDAPVKLEAEKKSLREGSQLETLLLRST